MHKKVRKCLIKICVSGITFSFAVPLCSFVCSRILKNVFCFTSISESEQKRKVHSTCHAILHEREKEKIYTSILLLQQEERRERAGKTLFPHDRTLQYNNIFGNTLFLRLVALTQKRFSKCILIPLTIQFMSFLFHHHDGRKKSPLNF
jgi:hypothetical protein